MTTKTNTPAAPDLSAWEMATSILAGLHQAEEKAQAEYTQCLAEAGGKPFGRGVTPAAHLLEALREARRNLDPDLRAIARANNLPMPK